VNSASKSSGSGRRSSLTANPRGLDSRSVARSVSAPAIGSKSFVAGRTGKGSSGGSFGSRNARNSNGGGGMSNRRCFEDGAPWVRATAAERGLSRASAPEDGGRSPAHSAAAKLPRPGRRIVSVRWRADHFVENAAERGRRGGVDSAGGAQAEPGRDRNGRECEGTTASSRAGADARIDWVVAFCEVEVAARAGGGRLRG
jgi:hypothetical protein